MLHPPNRIADYSTLLELLGPEGFERTACPVDVTDFVLKAIQEGIAHLATRAVSTRSSSCIGNSTSHPFLWIRFGKLTRAFRRTSFLAPALV